MTEYVWLVPAFPLVGVVINALFGRSHLRERAHLVAVPAVGLSFLAALVVSLPVFGGHTAHVEMYPWVVAGNLNVPVAFLVDPLSAVMMLTVTFVGFLIHVYSIGYMHGDPGYPRFFLYLNLFMFSMLMLVLADNYLLMFLGWEGVGLCSYLLIGFWYEKKTATDAGNKAFIVNRIGDAGFLLGLFLIWTTFGSLQYTEIFARTETLQSVLTGPGWGGLSLVGWMTLALFVGAAGKSAQIPLYVWLPDAMEGPTPVSALIHAATMVTAGVYMVARSSPLYSLAPETMALVALIGAGTAFFAATIACVQNDIKRVIAYSTISQLGYMFLGAGVGAYASGVFHLYTHAFFKALLFLGAGAVIHAMHGEQDIQRMGGLWAKMRLTAFTFLLGALANAGIFPLAGFWSKDEILFAAFSAGNYLAWSLGLAGAFLTAYYMFRLYFLAFAGEYRGDPRHAAHVHDAPPTMGIPLLVLALGAVAAGWIGFPPAHGPFHQFLAPALHGAGEVHHDVVLEVTLAAISLLVAGAGIGLAYLLYVRWRDLPELLAARFRGTYRILSHKYYVDELYHAIFVDGFRRFCLLFGKVDENVVDGAVNGTATLTLRVSDRSEWSDNRIVDGAVNKVGNIIRACSTTWRYVQTGLVQHYLLVMALGILLIFTLYVVFRP